MQKKNLGLIIFLAGIVVCSSLTQASTIEIKDADVTKGAVWYGYFANYPQSPYWHYETSSTFQAAYYYNPITYRAFAEFDLQQWTDLGEDVSHIQSVSFSFSHQHSANVLFNIYALNSSGIEDGVLTTSQYYSAAYYLANETTASNGSLQTTTIDVTSYVLDDINGPNEWSGFMMRLASEGSPHRIISFSNPILTIETDLPDPQAAQTVPEPATLILLGFGLVGLIKKRMRK